MVRLMILGLLRLKALSGYEIQRILQTSQTDIWAGVLPGSIYHALKKMDQEGLIAVDTVEQTGHRIKAIYKITEKGHEEFYQLLKESLREKSVVLPSTLYTGISFLQELNTEEQLEALTEQKIMLEKELAILKHGKETKEKYVEMNGIVKLQFENMFAHYELQINFLQKLIELVKQKGIETKLTSDEIDKYFK